MDEPQEKPKVKKIVKPRKMGKERTGGNDTLDEIVERKTQKIKLWYPHMLTNAGKFSHVDCDRVSILIMGVRMSMLQMEEYLGICGIIPKRTDYPEMDDGLKRGIRHNIDWTNGGMDAKLYGSKPAFEGLTRVQVLQHICTIVKIGDYTTCWLTAIIDNKDYLYIGVKPHKHDNHVDGTPGFQEYKYRSVMQFNMMQLEHIQRIMYRIPIADELLSPSDIKKLNDIRNGKLEKLPSFYVIDRPADVLSPNTVL